MREETENGFARCIYVMTFNLHGSPWTCARCRNFYRKSPASHRSVSVVALGSLSLSISTSISRSLALSLYLYTFLAFFSAFFELEQILYYVLMDVGKFLMCDIKAPLRRLSNLNGRLWRQQQQYRQRQPTFICINKHAKRGKWANKFIPRVKLTATKDR